MKHKKLFVVIIVCICIFIASLSTGIILAVNTLDWASVGTPGQFGEEIRRLIENYRIGFLFGGHPVNMKVNDSFDLDLTGINSIEISGVSEGITVGAKIGAQVSCSLKGDYFTLFNDLEYKWEKKGDRLLIYSKYPVFGFAGGTLEQQITVPVDFAGQIKVINVSGSTTVIGEASLKWTGLNCKSVSGSIQVNNTDMPAIGFTNISGSVSLGNCTAEVSGDTVSGSINLSTANFIGATLKSVSGGVAVQMPTAASCEFTFKSVSGSFNISGLQAEFSNQSASQTSGKINDGQYKLLVETVSGSLSIS